MFYIKPITLIAAIIPAVFITLLLALLFAIQIDPHQKDVSDLSPLPGAHLDSSIFLVLAFAFVSLMIVTLVACYRAIQGSQGTRVFLWSLAFLLFVLYYLWIEQFPFDAYLNELAGIALSFAVAGNLLLGFWLSQLKGRYRAQGKAIVMKQNLLAVAAHELRTPITNLRSQADLALAYIDEAALDEAKATLQMSLDDLDTLDHHVKSILALAALENGTLKTRKEWFPVSKMCHELNGQFAGSSKVALIWDCVGDVRIKVMDIHSDYDLIKVVVRNAIENALKHTSDGFVKISMVLGDHEVSISVRDTGSGMSTAEMDALQWHKGPLALGIRRGNDGWGIGMPVMKKFTEFLGGKIAIDSKLNFGTCLTINLPVAYRIGAVPKAEPELIRKCMPGKGGSMPLSETEHCKIKVLMIDDNHTFLKQMQRLFAPKIIGIDNVELTICDDPISGITRLEEQKFDLLLVDFHMPHIDGLKLLEWLKEHDHPNQGLVKVMLTADASIPERTRAAIVKAGARVVSKGMSIEDIRTLVSEVVRQKIRDQEYLNSVS